MTASTLRPQLRIALLRQLHQKHSGKRSLLQQGFTLVELMVVIIIVGILASVALPNFLSAKSKAEAGSLIGSMVGFSKECATNATIGDSSTTWADNIPSTITVSAKNCTAAAGVTLKNATAFDPTKVGGVRCGTLANGTPEVADGAADKTCTITISDKGVVTGAWS